MTAFLEIGYVFMTFFGYVDGYFYFDGCLMFKVFDW